MHYMYTVHSSTLYVFGTYSTQLFNEDRKKTDKIKITILKHQFFSAVCMYLHLYSTPS
jgi:hypothetical protein